MPYSEKSIANMACTRLGQKALFESSDGTIAGIDETALNIGDALEMVTLWYATARDATDRLFQYPGSQNFVALSVASDGDGEAWDDAWETAYVYPADALAIVGFVLRPTLFGGVGWSGDQWVAWSIPWAIGEFAGNVVIFADTTESAPVVQYVKGPANLQQMDALRASALAWRLAMELAVPLLGATEGARMMGVCEGKFQMASAAALAVAQGEADLGQHRDGNWAASRRTW